jgi:V/A-type H+-transporting ATPase subunit C
LLFADIENHLIAGGDMQKIAAGVFDEIDEISALLAELEGTIFYKPLMEALPEYEKDESLYILEKVIEEAYLTVGKDAAITQPYGISPVLGFLSMKDTEVRNIRAISRAKEAGLSPDKIREFVLRV